MMRFVTHKLGFLIVSGMIASVVSITTMLPSREIVLMNVPEPQGTVVIQEVMLAANVVE